MGQSILNTVVQLLNDKGLCTEPAQPAANMTAIHMPVAAVSLEEADRAKQTATVLVEIVAPVVSGALRCQHKALDVCDILSKAGAVCHQGKCTFDSRSALFITPVTAVFSGIALSNDWIPSQVNRISINEADLPYCVSFTANKKVTEDNATLADVPWTITIEEFIPTGVLEPEELTEAFNTSINSQDKRETYAFCKLVGIQRIATPEGIRQIRTATTTHRALEEE